MSPTAVRRAIEAPAARAGLRLEPGLVEVLLRDAGVTAMADRDDSGGGLAVGMLPLLSHALLETWQHRAGDTLTVDGYLTAGGIRGAVATTAEACYQALDPGEQAIARQVLLRLVTVEEGTGPTRRRVDRAELLEGRPAEQATRIAAVLDRLAAARLVTMDRDTVEVTHEALLGAWPRLRDWLRDDRDALRIHRQLTDAARIWAGLDRDPSALYQGTRLAAATEWAADPRWAGDLAPREREFLDASRARQASDQQALRRRNRLLLQLSGGLAALLAVALVASGIAFQQRNHARQQRNQAQQQHRIAVSNALVAQSVAEYRRDPSTALLLGVAAVRMAPTTDARSNLLSLTGRDQLTALLPGHRLDVYDVAFSPDGRILATAGGDKTVRLWDARRHGPLATLTGRRGLVWAVAFSPDGRTLASASGRVQLWDVQRRALLATLPGHATSAVAFSPDGRTLAAAINGAVQLWDVQRRVLLATLPGVGGSVTFSPDGRTLAGITFNQGVQLWDVRRRVPVATLLGQTNTLDDVVFSPDERTLAVTTANQGVQLWDVRRRVLLTTLASRDRGVSEAAFSPDGHILAVTNSENELQLWRIDNGPRSLNQVPWRILTGNIGRVEAMAFSPEGQTLVTAAEKTIGVWDLEPVLFAPHGRVTFSPDGRTIATGSDGGGSRLWDLRRRTWLPVRFGVGTVFSSNWRTVAAFTRPDTVQLWEGRRWTRQSSLRVHTDQTVIPVLALSPDGSKLAIPTDENSIQLWDVRERTPLATLVDRTRAKPRSNSDFANYWISFSPDGRTLAATIYGAVQLWDVRRQVLLATLPGVTGAVTFSPDGHTLAASSDNTVRLWNLERHALMATLTGHTDDVLDVSYSPDGRTLATASADDTVRLWNVDQHALVATLTGHDKDVGEVAFSPDGHTLVTASLDGTVRLWAADISHAVKQICDAVGHDLSRQQWMRFLPESPYQHTCT